MLNRNRSGKASAFSGVYALRQACVTGMFELRDFSAFKQHARDFLVQTKSFADKDNAELFAEEAAAMREVRGPASQRLSTQVSACLGVRKEVSSI